MPNERRRGSAVFHTNAEGLIMTLGKKCRMSVDRAFWARIEKTDGCWWWRGPLMPNGYGHLVADGIRYKAHRLSYQLAHGPIPSGLLVLHSCDNRGCVNPAHLRIGTQVDNMEDCVARGRFRPGGKPIDPITRRVRDQRGDLSISLQTEQLSRSVRQMSANGCTKQCLICGEIKPATTAYFYRRSGSAKALMPYCRPCQNADTIAKRAGKAARKMPADPTPRCFVLGPRA